jgi:hypothetical protein
MKPVKNLCFSHIFNRYALRRFYNIDKFNCCIQIHCRIVILLCTTDNIDRLNFCIQIHTVELLSSCTLLTKLTDWTVAHKYTLRNCYLSAHCWQQWQIELLHTNTQCGIVIFLCIADNNDRLNSCIQIHCGIVILLCTADNIDRLNSCIQIHTVELLSPCTLLNVMPEIQEVCIYTNILNSNEWQRWNCMHLQRNSNIPLFYYVRKTVSKIFLIVINYYECR